MGNFSDKERRRPTSLHVSSESGHSEVVHALLAAKADANIADEGVTPLHRSSKKTGKTSVVQALLAAKADVNFVSDDGRTPLLQCCFDGRIDVAEILLQASADPNVADKNGKTPLSISISKRCVKVRNMLTTHGARI